MKKVKIVKLNAKAKKNIELFLRPLFWETDVAGWVFIFI